MSDKETIAELQKQLAALTKVVKDQEARLVSVESHLEQTAAKLASVESRRPNP